MLENKGKARCQLWNRAMKINLSDMLSKSNKTQKERIDMPNYIEVD